MAFLGIFKRDDGLEKIKEEDVKKDIQGIEREESRVGRQADAYRVEIATKTDFAVNERNISESELAHVSSDISDLKNDLAATDDELFRLREEKRAMKGLLIVIQRKERLKRYKVWGRIKKMSPDKLENGLRELGDADASVSESVDMIWRILGTPATPRQMRERMTPEARQELDELKSKRDANAAQRVASAPSPDNQRTVSTPPVGNIPPTTTSASNASGGAFWVYEDDVTNRARVHRSDCGHCNPHEPRLPDNRWHGPYATREDAFEIERRLAKRDTGGCGICKP